MSRKTTSKLTSVCEVLLLLLGCICFSQALFTEDFQRYSSHVRRSTRNEESSLHSSDGRSNLYEIRKVSWDEPRENQRKLSEYKKMIKKEEEDERQTTIPEHWKVGKVDSALEGAKLAYQKIPRDDVEESIMESQVRLPDTSGIPGQLTEKLGVERFFSLWMVFNNVESAPPHHGNPFVIFAPVDKHALLESPVPPLEQLLAKPHVLRNLLLSHILVGKSALPLIKQKAIVPDGYQDAHSDEDRKIGGNFTTLSGKVITLQYKDGYLWANGNIRVQTPGIQVPKGVLLLVNKYLFLEDINRSLNSKPYPLIQGTYGDKEEPHVQYEFKTPAEFEEKREFINAETFLYFLNSSLLKIPSAEAFRLFLIASNISDCLCQGENYTVIVPPNEAFRSWEPIDYGFRPFSIHEFLSVVIRNHIVRGAVHLSSLKDGDLLETVDGGQLIFRHPIGKLPSINGVELYDIQNSEITIPRGKILLLRSHKVLFVNEEVVRRLRKLHPEAESGPPILVDWTGSSFLAYVSINLHERSHVLEDKIIDDFLPEPVEINYERHTQIPDTNTTVAKDDIEMNATAETSMITLTTQIPDLCNPVVYDLVCVEETTSPSTSESPSPTLECCEVNKISGGVLQEDLFSFGNESLDGAKPGRDWMKLFSRDDSKPNDHIPAISEMRNDSFNHMLRIIHQAGGHIESREPEGYTIFVPTDYGLESASFPEEGPLRDSWALSILYNHMVVGRIVEKHLKVGAKFVTLGNKTVTVCKNEGFLWLNRARIIESNIFIYDLGAMVIVDGPVFSFPFLDENSKWTYSVCE